MKAGYLAWTDAEMVRLRELDGAGAGVAAIAAELGRSENAVRIRLQRHVREPLDPDVNRGWGKGRPGRTRFWTRERTLDGLRDFARRNRGPLPSSDHDYSVLKKGHLEWPTATRVLEYFGTMADAWAAAGASKSRYQRGWVEWSQADDDLLLDLAGEMTLKVIAKRLGRSWSACKRRLYDLGAGRSRDVSGHLSMMQVAKEYGCPLSRVKKLVRDGVLPAKRIQGGHYWRILPEDCERVKHLLAAPKRSHTSTPPSFGDYDRRYGLRRRVIDGRVMRVPA